MRATINGCQFNFEVQERRGAPWITFAHALTNNLTLWNDVVAALGDRYSILRYDQRGHGGSEPVAGPYSFPMLIADAVGLLGHVGIDKTHWVGLSIGGMIGYGLAIDHGDRLHSLTACDSRDEAPPDYAAYFQSRIDKAREHGMEGVVESTVERWFTPASLAAKLPVIDKVRNMIRTTSTSGHEGCCEALKTLSFGSRCHEIQVPTLILGGAKDKGAPPEKLASIAAKIPGARQVVIPEAGHITALENPEAFRAALTQFLEEQA